MMKYILDIMYARETLFLVCASLTLVCISGQKHVDFKRTIVFVKIDTRFGENVFLRGGRIGSCVASKESNSCAIPIRHRIHHHRAIASASTTWSVGDNFLDWQGGEPKQNSFNGINPQGTPMSWTTSKSEYTSGFPTVEQDGFGFTPLNTFGSGFWMLDVDMDCSKTNEGWFQFKTFITPTVGWEADINQTSSCGGDVHIISTLNTNNHQGLCGKMNLFYYESGGCVINHIKQDTDINEECGLKHVKQWRVINGRPASEGAWPWIGEILYKGNHGCGAVLLSPKWAVTAGHCVRTAKTNGPWTTILRMGETNRHNSSGIEGDYFVKRIINHPLFDKSSETFADNDHDIALLELASAVDVAKPEITTACLPFMVHNIDDFVDKECWITGWGSTQGTGDRMVLQELRVNVTTAEHCSALYGKKVSTRQICAGQGNRQACQGDSGSPLSCRVKNKWYVVGVVSWGDDGCHGRPTVFTRISSFLHWIEKETSLHISKTETIG